MSISVSVYNICLVDHGYDGDAQSFAETHHTEATDECHDIEDQSTAWNVETMNGLVLHWSGAITAWSWSFQYVTRFRFAAIRRGFVVRGFVLQPVVHVSDSCYETVVTCNCANTETKWWTSSVAERKISAYLHVIWLKTGRLISTWRNNKGFHSCIRSKVFFIILAEKRSVYLYCFRDIASI